VAVALAVIGRNQGGIKEMRWKFWVKPLRVEDVFTKAELDEITSSVKKAEALTSGEIRVVLRSTCEKKLRRYSTKIQAMIDFEEYGLANTRDKTGVLILVVLQSKKVEVLADKGINDQVPKGYWNDVVNLILYGFRKDNPCSGICLAVENVGQMLAEKFPRKPDDTNELADEPVIAH